METSAAPPNLPALPPTPGDTDPASDLGSAQPLAASAQELKQGDSQRTLGKDVPEMFINNFASLDVDHTGALTHTQVFAALNLGRKPEDMFQYTEVAEACREVDVDNSMLIRQDQLETLWTYLTSASKVDLPLGRWFGFIVFVYCAAPITVIWGFPGLKSEFGTNVRHVLRKSLVFLQVPYKARALLLDTTWGYALQAFGLLWVYTTTIVNGAAYSALAPQENMPVNVSGAEIIIPPVGLLGAVFIMASTFVLTDKSSFEAQEASLRDTTPLHKHMSSVQSKDRTMLSEMRVVCGDGDEEISAQDVLAQLLYMNPEERKWLKRKVFGVGVFSVIACLFFASIPFIVRATFGSNIVGKCDTSVNGVETKCGPVNNFWAFMAITSFLNNAVVGYFYLFSLFSSFSLFDELSTAFERLRIVLYKAEAATAVPQLPYMSLQYAENVLAWTKLRIYMLNFKTAARKQVEIIIGFMLFFLMTVAVPTMIFIRVDGFNQPINNRSVESFVGFVLLTLGLFVLYPTLFRGLAINTALDNYKTFFALEKMLLQHNLEVPPSKEWAERADHAQRLVEAAHAHMCEVDSTFQLMGFPVTTEFVVATGSPLVASIVAFVQDGFA